MLSRSQLPEPETGTNLAGVEIVVPLSIMLVLFIASTTVLAVKLWRVTSESTHDADVIDDAELRMGLQSSEAGGTCASNVVEMHDIKINH